MIEATFFPDRFVLGWPKADDARAIVAPAGEVLSTRYKTDAHFSAYASDVPRRHTIALFKDAAHADKIATVNLRMALAVFDVDGPEHVATEEWLCAEVDKLAELFDAHPGAFFYTTRGGYRLVYALPAPFPTRGQSDDDAWTIRYLSWCRYLARRFDIRVDEACADWTRLYRLPHVVRDGQVTTPEIIGNPNALGTWAPKLAKSDIAARPAKAGTETYGAVEPVPIADPTNVYGRVRIEAAVRYLMTAPLSIEGQRGRDVFFGVACYLMRRLRMPLDVAADCVEAIYNDRLVKAGTTTWERRELENRLASARDTSSAVPPGDVLDEEAWHAVFGVARAS